MSDGQEHPLYKRALECKTEELDLHCESVCLAACGAGLYAFRSAGMLLAVGGACACGVEGVCGAFCCW